MSAISEFWIAIPVGLAAMAEDVWRRQISNWTAVAALIAGIAWNVMRSGWSGLGSAALGAVCGFSVFLVFYLLGGMGGGDVKLMAGFGALLGAGRTLQAALWVAGLGGVLAILVLSFRAVRRIFRQRTKSPVKDRSADSGGKADDFIPYAPAIALGVWMTLLAKSL